jgi:hypothetical protein
MMKKNIKWRGKIIIIVLFSSLFIFFNSQSSPILTTQAASGSFSEDFTSTTYMDGAQTNATGWGIGSIENSKKKPTIVGSISSSLIGNAVDVYIDGDYAYVTNEGEGLKVVNITDPTNPYVIGTYVTNSTAQSVYVDGDYVFIADYKGIPQQYKNFLILDVTNPTNPIHLGNCTTNLVVGDAARDVVVVGDTAFVANDQGGVSVVNVADPSNPIRIVEKDTAGTAINLAVSGDYVYVADGTKGLVVIDISNTLVPTIAATYNTSISFATNIIVEGNFAYVVDLNNGIVVVNITDPTTPTFAGSWSKSDVSAANIYGDYLYVTDITGGLSVVSITDPTTPVFIYTIALPGFTQSIVIDGHYAYLTCQSGGFQVVRIADPSAPTLAGSYNTPSEAWGVFISGDYAYVADRLSGLQVIDINDPSSPTLVGSYNTPGDAWSVVVSGDYAYVADWTSGLQILDISDPSAPTLAGSYNTPSGAYGVLISGDYAYVADYFSGLQILDISDPSTPTLAGSYDTPDRAYDVFISGDFAYVTDHSSGLQVIDISDPSSPTLAGSYNTPGEAWGVFVSGDYAYVADHSAGGLQVLDISNPHSPTFTGSYNTPGEAHDIFVSGDYAYVADYSSGLQVIDISDPSTPTLAGSYNTPGDVSDVFVSGDFAFVTDTTNGLLVLEVRKNKAHQFDSPCIAQSTEILTGTGSYSLDNANLSTSDTIPSDSSVTYFLTADNGLHWEVATPNIKHDFINLGNQLKWKAIMTTTNISVTAEIYSISITYETVLDHPTLLQPIDGAITDDYTPSFTWNTISGANEYVFQLDTFSSFTTPIINVTIPSSSTSYTAGTPISINTYYWRVAAVDSNGDVGTFASYRTLYIIQDITTPVIDHPNDVSYELGTTGNSITWISTDSNPYWYNITMNGILTSHDDPWLGGSIVMNIDGLPLGTHTVVCSVYDLDGLVTSDTVDVEVVSTAPPSIDVVADFPYEEETTGNSITWHPSDANPDYYSITRDGIVIDDGPWLGGDISINIDGLTYGVYTYVCTINDTEGQEAFDTVIVTVTDSVVPNLSSPADVIYSEGDTGNNIIWVAADTNPATYIVYKDGTFYEGDTWVSGSSIIVSVDDLTSGSQYNFTILVVDQAGNSARDTVIVAVTAGVPEFNQSVFLAIVSITVVFVLYLFKRRTLKKS